MKINVKIITSENNLKIAFSIRKNVFVEEQKVSEDIERDKFEYEANHALAFVGDKPVGTARWRQTQKGVKLERFAVLPEFRSCGVGKYFVQICTTTPCMIKGAKKLTEVCNHYRININ